MLDNGAKKSGRNRLAQATGISERELLDWVNRADLIRVKGVGSEFSDLLEEAGVDSCTELGHRTAGHLHAKLVEVNAAKKLVRRLPTESEVQGWITEAKTIPKVVEY